jgi:hypothetical protein
MACLPNSIATMLDLRYRLQAYALFWMVSLAPMMADDAAMLAMIFC